MMPKESVDLPAGGSATVVCHETESQNNVTHISHSDEAEIESGRDVAIRVAGESLAPGDWALESCADCTVVAMTAERPTYGRVGNIGESASIDVRGGYFQDRSIKAVFQIIAVMKIELVFEHQVNDDDRGIESIIEDVIRGGGEGIVRRRVRSETGGDPEWSASHIYSL